MDALANDAAADEHGFDDVAKPSGPLMAFHCVDCVDGIQAPVPFGLALMFEVFGGQKSNLNLAVGLLRLVAVLCLVACCA